MTPSRHAVMTCGMVEIMGDEPTYLEQYQPVWVAELLALAESLT